MTLDYKDDEMEYPLKDLVVIRNAKMLHTIQMEFDQKFSHTPHFVIKWF